MRVIIDLKTFEVADTVWVLGCVDQDIARKSAIDLECRTSTVDLGLRLDAWTGFVGLL